MHSDSAPRNLCARFVSSAAFILLASAVAALSAAQPAAAASKYKVVHQFCMDFPICSDGSDVASPLVRDAEGNLFGAAIHGAYADYGTIYELAADGTFRVLHTFCDSCGEGYWPRGRLVVDVNGNLYGTTSGGGGSNQQGTIFQLHPNATRTGWKYKVLHSFCAKDGCPDGGNPYAGLNYDGAATGALYDGTSPLFGTTNEGGKYGGGTVFQLSVPAGKTHFVEKVLYSFCKKEQCGDGSNPLAEITPDGHGNLFGTAHYGANDNSGGVFELTPKGKGYAYTLLYAFCPEQGCADGRSPWGPVTIDADGSLVGVAGEGAHHDGVIFRVMPAGTSSTEKVLYDFCAKTDCTDGIGPQGSIAIDSQGAIYGTTFAGGNAMGDGTLYRLNGNKLTTLYSFCADEDACQDGRNPTGGVILDPVGHIFGTASYNYDDSSNYGGTVFKFSR